MIKGFLKSKKSNAVLDTITIVVFLLIFSIVMIAGYKVFNQMKPQLLVAVNSSPDAVNIVNTSNTRYPLLFDSLFVFIFVGLWITALVSAYLLDTNPVFLAFSIMLIIFILGAGAFIQNFYETFSLDPQMASTIASFPMMNFIMLHLFIFAIVVSTTICIVLYGKSRY